MKIKQDLLQACMDYANKRISRYKNEVDTIKESIESNDKTSDNDDDSGNGKLFNDLEKNSQYLNEANKMLDGLKNMSPNTISDKVILGSVVKTTNNNIFITVSAGKISLEEGSYLAMRFYSSICVWLMNTSKSDKVDF